MFVHRHKNLGRQRYTEDQPLSNSQLRNCQLDLFQVGDGICDDAIDKAKDCLHDMGDCCQPVINATRCSECHCTWYDKYQPTSLEEMLFQELQEPQDWYTFYANSNPKGHAVQDIYPQ